MDAGELTTGKKSSGYPLTKPLAVLGRIVHTTVSATRGLSPAPALGLQLMVVAAVEEATVVMVSVPMERLLLLNLVSMVIRVDEVDGAVKEKVNVAPPSAVTRPVVVKLGVVDAVKSDARAVVGPLSSRTVIVQDTDPDTRTVEVLVDAAG